MTAHPSTTSLPTGDQTILEDIFIHVTGRSRSVVGAWQAVHEIFEKDDKLPDSVTLTRRDLVHLSDAIGAVKTATTDLCARVAVAIVRRTEIVRQLHLDATVPDITSEEADDLARGIFEESGIAEDFLAWGEQPEGARP